MCVFIMLPGHQAPDFCGSQRGLKGGAEPMARWPGLDLHLGLAFPAAGRKKSVCVGGGLDSGGAEAATTP